MLNRTLGVGVILLAALSESCSRKPTYSKEDLARQVGNLREEVKTLQEQQKALSSEVDQLKKELAAPRPNPVTQPQTPAQSPPAVSLALAPEPPGVPKPPAPARDVPGDPEALYREAFGKMQAGQAERAEELFSEFVRNFPQHNLADNAQYWLGECYYGQKDYEAALEAFGFVSEWFPNGNKVPDALYKQALCEKLLGKEQAAIQTVHLLTAKYPGTEAATKAAQLFK